MARPDLAAARARLRGLVTSPVAEPIADAHWHRAEIALGWAGLALVLGDVATELAIARGAYPEHAAQAYHRFVAGHGTANLVGLVICIASARWARSERGKRAALQLYLVAVCTAITFALWVYGEGSLNIAWFLVLIVAFRIFFDVRLGRWALLCALAGTSTLAALLALGIVAPDPLLSGTSAPPSPVGRFTSFFTALVGTWLCAHYVAVRIRTTEHELRSLNATLEQRVQREVAERSKDLTAAVLSLSREQHEIAADTVVDGRYRILRRIGEGGMGSVWNAERIADGQRVAVKVLRSQSDPAIVARFAREAQIAATITHPNLVPVLDVGLADGRIFLVMPLVEAGSLDHQRERFGQRDWAVPILAGIAQGLAALHSRGVVHRDLKPSNVLVADGIARITDLGIARVVGELATPASPSDTARSPQGSVPDSSAPTLLGDSGNLTRAGEMLGTPYYMAPELAEITADAGPAADVFAFGVIACELLTGKPPFREPPILSRRMGRPIATPPREALDAVSPLLCRCMEGEAQLRPSSAQLVAALRAVAAELPSPPRSS